MTTMPTLAEIPPAAAGDFRDGNEMRDLALISTVDGNIRSAAIRLFLIGERQFNAVGIELDGAPTVVDLLKEACDIRAQTPGGLAWKLVQVVKYFEPEDNEPWRWWHSLLTSALTDAIEMERARLDREGGTS